MRLLTGRIALISVWTMIWLLGVAWAEDGEVIREAHRTAALAYLDSFESGSLMQGELTQNGAQGEFAALYWEDTWYVRQRFGDIVSLSESNAETTWVGNNHQLPYQLSEEDHPANLAINLLASGRYLEDPYWDDFHYVSESAGTYEFSFTPAGLPPLQVLVYDDEGEPEHLQVMSVELPFAPNDPDSLRYRAYYYYQADAEGNLALLRETGRELDANNEEVNFVEFTVDSIELLTELPEDMRLSHARVPVAEIPALAGPVTIPVEIVNGFFLVPVEFSSGKTYKFILDTGAEASLFLPEVAADSGMETSMELTVHGHGSRIMVEMGMVKDAVLNSQDGAQQVQLPAFPATVIPAGNESVINALRFNQTAGILGLSMLHQYVVTFDHPGRQLLLWSPDQFDPAAVSGTLFELDLDVEDLIYCDGSLAGVSGEWVIDSGLQADLAVLGETVDHAGITLEVLGQRNSTVVGGDRAFDQVMVPSYTLGGLEAGEQRATVTGDDRGTLSARGLLGFIGVTLFFDAQVTIDLFNQKMYVAFPPMDALDDQANIEDIPQLGDFVGEDRESAEESEATEE